MMELVDFQLREGNAVTDQYGAYVDCTGMEYGDEVFIAFQSVVSGGGNSFYSDLGAGPAGLIWGGGVLGISVASDGIGGAIFHHRVEGPGVVDDLTGNGAGVLSKIGFKIVSEDFGDSVAAWIFRGNGEYSPVGLDMDAHVGGDGAAVVPSPQDLPLDMGALLRPNQALLAMGYGLVYNPGFMVARALDITDDSGFDSLALGSDWLKGSGLYSSQAHRALSAVGGGADATRVTFTLEEIGASTDNWIPAVMGAVVNFTKPFEAVGLDGWALL